MFLPSVKLFFNILHQISQFVNTIFYEIFITAQNSFWAGCAVRPYGINGRSTNGRKWKGDWKSVQTRLLHEIWGNADLQGAAILHEGTDDGEGVKACGIGQAESLNLIKQNPRIGRDRLKQRMEQQGVMIAESNMHSTVHSARWQTRALSEWIERKAPVKSRRTDYTL